MECPVFGISRHRIATDGEGVTTLVAFHRCTLHCHYCLNPQSLDPTTPCQVLTPEALLDATLIDNLYFLATGGGITFAEVPQDEKSAISHRGNALRLLRKMLES